MTELSDRTESLFAAAIELPPDERQAFLDHECGENQGLRDQLDALLQAHDRANHFLDRGPLEVVAETVIHPSKDVGTIIAGRYKLLEQIGEGGMGTVWVAEQFEPVRRKVALKLIKAGMDSKSVLARFEAERQALALMDHPNIAKVLDGGLTESGRPYFVMEYVKGVPITEYCDAGRLSVTERLNLFLQVCSAVQHAHQKGIIHRDLKPSNVLVAPYDDKPVPKVIDFGLAKAMNQSLTDKTLHTAHEMVLGTPLYMSPEQAQLNNLDVDTRTDIYALGVLLYELLTGTTPFEKESFKTAAWEEVRRIIREVDPPRPSLRLSSAQTLPSVAACRHTEPFKLTQQVRGDLDWIVMKALEKDRTRRYETANGLARDLERYLADDVVEARPPSRSYRLRKFIRRNRGQVIGGGLLLATLLVGIVVTSFLLMHVDRLRKYAQEQARQAHQKELEADAAARHQSELRLIAENAVDEMLRLLELQITDAASDALISQLTITDQQRKLLEIGREYFRKLSEQQGTDETVRSRVAAAAFQLAKLEYYISEESAGSQALEIALKGYTGLNSEFPENRVYQYQLAGCHYFRAVVNAEFNSVDAIKEFKLAFDLATELTETTPDNPEYQQLLAYVHTGMGIACLISGQLAEADFHTLKAVQIMEQVAARHEDLEYQYAWARALQAQSVIFGRTNRKSEGAEPFLKNVEIIREIIEKVERSDHHRPKYLYAYAQSLHNMARYYQVAGKLQLALSTYREGQTFCEELVKEFPALAAGYRRLLGRIHVSQGITLQTLGDSKAACDQVQIAQQVHRELFNENESSPEPRWELALADGYLGTLLRDASDLDGSLLQLTAAIDLAEGLEHQEYTRMQGLGTLPHYLGERAITYDRLEKYDKALADWDEAIRACQRDRSHDIAAYELGRLATLIQQGETTADEAVAEATQQNHFDSAEEKCTNRLYHFVRFYAIAAQHCPEGSDSRQRNLESAMGLLETLIERIGPCFVDLAPGNVDFEILHDHSGFKALQESIAMKAMDMNEGLTTE